MSGFRGKSLCVVGRQPEFGVAELESLYGAERIKPLPNAVLLDFAAEVIDFKRLGGTVKTARILTTLPYTDWRRLASYLQSAIPKHLAALPGGKFTLGLSVYGLRLSVPELNSSLLTIKKSIKATGRPARVVPNKSLALSSAQVLHNKLTHRGSWEILLVADGQKTIIAQTLFVQDIEAYAGRDQARPARDARVGMLPPKLAQIIINLAIGGVQQSQRILDPFCGTGITLQEALLMGYSVIGTDLDKRMTAYAQDNVRWLVQKYPNIAGHVAIETADATVCRWPRFNVVASEVYLGRPLAKLPDEASLSRIVAGTNTILKKFLTNLSPQLKSGQRLCLAVPAWHRPNEAFVRLPVLAQLKDMGYNIKSFRHVDSAQLIYHRHDQVVARQLLVLERQ